MAAVWCLQFPFHDRRNVPPRAAGEYNPPNPDEDRTTYDEGRFATEPVRSGVSLLAILPHG